jgi:hypothetical protein
MSSSKLDTSGVFEPLTVHSQQTQLSLPPGAVKVHKGGIEFRTLKPMSVWKEMTVEMQTPSDHKKVKFTGVVVACNGNRHTGYQVSMVITSLSRQSQERLDMLAISNAV